MLRTSESILTRLEIKLLFNNGLSYHNGMPRIRNDLLGGIKVGSVVDRKLHVWTFRLIGGSRVLDVRIWSEL